MIINCYVYIKVIRSCFIAKNIITAKGTNSQGDISKYPLFVKNSCKYYGADNSDGNHYADGRCVKCGHKDEKRKHKYDGRDRELEVL